MPLFIFQFKKCGMKDVGMKDGMACYKHIGKKCVEVKKSIGVMAVSYLGLF